MYTCMRPSFLLHNDCSSSQVWSTSFCFVSLKNHAAHGHIIGAGYINKIAVLMQTTPREVKATHPSDWTRYSY